MIVTGIYAIRGCTFNSGSVHPRHDVRVYIYIYTVEINGGEEFREKKRRREFTIRYTRATRSLRSGRNGLIES